MTELSSPDSWAGGQSYEKFMGQYSHRIAKLFLEWLKPPPKLRWLEIGCGTGALSEIILSHGLPKSLLAIDPSAKFIEFARHRISDPRASFQVGDSQSLSQIPLSIDIVAFGLVLNFIPDPVIALHAMRRTLKPNGVLAFYVWDYGGKMEMLRYFWDGAVAIDPDARFLVESFRYPFCQPDNLTQLCRQVSLQNIEVIGLEIPITFSSFDDYWAPFLGGQGPAPSYVARLDSSKRKNLKDFLQASLPIRDDGSLDLIARAWAVRATS